MFSKQSMFFVTVGLCLLIGGPIMADQQSEAGISTDVLRAPEFAGSDAYANVMSSSALLGAMIVVPDSADLCSTPKALSTVGVSPACHEPCFQLYLECQNSCRFGSCFCFDVYAFCVEDCEQ